MIEWPLMMMAGLLGSAHCLGMCGPFALMIGGTATGWRANLVRQACWSAGRIFTYAVLGAVAAFVGLRAARSAAHWVDLSAVLAVVAGLFLVVQGLVATGLLPRRGIGAGGACPGAAGLRALLTARGGHELFLAGMFTGLLPCGLLYGMLGLAAATHDIPRGIGTMVAFGLGTVPALATAGLGGAVAGPAVRRRLHAIAAWCLVATGCLSVARGAGFLLAPAGPAAEQCPFCAAGVTAPDAGLAPRH